VKISLTTPTGNIGSKLAEILLQTPDVQLTVLARDPKKVEHLAARGVRVVAGNQLDPTSVDNTVAGTEVLFWLSGIDYTTTDLRAHYNRFADAAVTALQRHPNLRIVNLSSVGAELPDRTGPIKGLHDAEQKLNAAGANVTHLRANYFMENVLSALPAIAHDSAIYSVVSGSVALRQVATADIAAAAAHYLLKGPSGQHVVDISGPEKITFDQVAAAVSAAIGVSVKHVQVTPDVLQTALTASGLTTDLANQLVELQQAIAAGLLRAVGDSEWHGDIRFAQFTEGVVAPAYRREAASLAKKRA
jgi:uncharacterized protein YbjT (DUF2867 family)